jgi:hypothetical protein
LGWGGLGGGVEWVRGWNGVGYEVGMGWVRGVSWGEMGGEVGGRAGSATAARSYTCHGYTCHGLHLLQAAPPPLKLHCTR